MQAGPKRKKLFRIFVGLFAFLLFVLLNVFTYDINKNRYYEFEVANGEVTHIFIAYEKRYITINDKDYYVDAKTYKDSVIGQHKVLTNKGDKINDNGYILLLCFITLFIDLAICLIISIFMICFILYSITWALHYSDGKYTYKEYIHKNFW